MNRLTANEALTRAGRAIGKIDRGGRRGLSLVTYEEIEAMACLLVLHGVPALQADQVIADREPPVDPPVEGDAQ